MNNKVRFVRCPRCLKVLPEITEHPVYQCGGCGTILRAKIRKSDTDDRGVGLHETDPTEKNDKEQVGNDKEVSSSLNQQATIMSTEESGLDKKSKGDQNETNDCKKERHGGVYNIDELPSSTELTYSENGASSPEAGAHMEEEEEEDKCALDQYEKRGSNEFGDDNEEHPGQMNFSGEASSSTELNRDKNESSSPLEVDESKYPLEQNNGGDRTDFGDCSRESPGNINFSEEPYSAIELTSHEIEEPSQVARKETEKTDNLKSHLVLRSSSSENFLDARTNVSSISCRKSSSESISSDNLQSPSSKQMSQAHNCVLQGFERVGSVDTLKNSVYVNPRPDLGDTLGQLSNSRTTRSFYAYDGSESSCNETGSQIPDRHFHLPKKGVTRRNEYMATSNMSNDSETKYKISKGSPVLPVKKHHIHAPRGTQCHRDELPGLTRHSHPVRSVMRLETDEIPSRMPFYSRGSQTGRSRRGRNEFQYSSSYSVDKPEYPQSDRGELLRMVYELQEQLNKTYFSKDNVDGRFPTRVLKKEKQFSSYHDHFTRVKDIYPELIDPRIPGRYNQGNIRSQQRNTSQMAFSGEVCRHQVDCSCLHCCPQEWHFSGQLPPHVVCCNKGYDMPHPGHNYYSPYLSGPTSPLQYTRSEFSSWTHDTKLEDLRHKDHELKRSTWREKQHSMKRHFRPIAGATPVISCYRCRELLQLPADFLLCGRRYHRLRCGACSEVLKFSLEKNIHVVPYVADAIAPPPSEVDDYTDTIKKKNLASVSRANDCPHSEQMSCSDDYGQLFGKSFSTEGDPSPLAPPVYTLKRHSNARKMSYGSSFGRMEGRKKAVLNESRNKYKNPVETIDSAQSSSNVLKQEKSSSETEEFPPTKSTTLHRLMGYSSPSRVING